MMKNNKNKCRLSHDDCEGYVQTDLEAASWCGMGGMSFNADVVTEKGQAKVSYFVRSSDVSETAKWYTIKRGRLVPLEEVEMQEAAQWN
jgi:hypothetical protein